MTLAGLRSSWGRSQRRPPVWRRQLDQEPPQQDQAAQARPSPLQPCKGPKPKQVRPVRRLRRWKRRQRQSHPGQTRRRRRARSPLGPEGCYISQGWPEAELCHISLLPSHFSLLLCEHRAPATSFLQRKAGTGERGCRGQRPDFKP